MNDTPACGNSLRQLDDDLWVAEAPLRFGGVEIGARMTVIRLPDSRLLLISPVTATGELVEAAEALGEIAFLAAPNKLHHLFVGEWAERFPQAEVHVAPGLETKRSDLDVTSVLDGRSQPPWSGSVEQEFVAGYPFANEVVFFHPASGTLVLQDLAFNVGPHSPPLTRFAFRLIGAYGRFTHTIVERLLVRDRAAFRRSLERILAWEIDRVIVAHGAVLEQGGREALAKTYDWVLKR